MSGEFGVAEVAELFADFAAALGRNEDRLNSLNVFPVADNDTGTNMVGTLDAIVAALRVLPADAVNTSSVIAAVETAALDGRGNSGLIVGQFLAGFTSVGSADNVDLARGLAAAATRARRAVARPVDGTMLTLADAVATAAATDPDPAILARVAAEAVAATTAQLDVLAERGVVDSGAAGLALFFDALAERRGGAPASLIECRVGLDPVSGEVGGGVVGHEVQFRVPTTIVDAETVRALLSNLGSDVVVAASANEIAAHVHVVDPNVAVNAISADLEGRLGAKAISYDVEPLLEGGRP